MITGFEEYTFELSEYEREELMPVIKEGLSTKIGKEKAVTNSYIVARLKQKGYKISGPRVRKIIHELRVTHQVPCLISSSKGYYITTDPEEVKEYMLSIKARTNSINAIYEALGKQMISMIQGGQLELEMDKSNG